MTARRRTPAPTVAEMQYQLARAERERARLAEKLRVAEARAAKPPPGMVRNDLKVITPTDIRSRTHARCGRRHATVGEVVRCVWGPELASVTGTGPFAVLSACPVTELAGWRMFPQVSVTLRRSEADALVALAESCHDDCAGVHAVYALADAVPVAA